MNESVRKKSRQKGFSTIALIIIVAVVGTLLLAFFRGFPMVYENLRLQSVLDGLQQQADLDVRSKRAIWESMQKRMYVGDVRSVKRENVTITRADGQTTVKVKYQTTAPFVANFFLGADFENQVVIDR